MKFRPVLISRSECRVPADEIFVSMSTPLQSHGSPAKGFRLLHRLFVPLEHVLQIEQMTHIIGERSMQLGKASRGNRSGANRRNQEAFLH